jgi:hypothetical protein
MRESEATLARLQRIIDRSTRSAGAALARNFIGGGWRMDAREFVAFWGEERMASISTVSPAGRVHAAPIDVRLVDGVFYTAAFADSVRLADHRANRRCAITASEDAYRAVIVYGAAREVDADPTGRTAAVSGEQGYPPGGVVTVAITPTRIYGIRPPAGHAAARP